VEAVLTKRIIFFGQPATIGCDVKCEKAWGVNSRPKRYLGGDPDEPGISSDESCSRADDYVFLPDSALPTAPVDPGTHEGSSGKPRSVEDRLNRWCARECERCVMTKAGLPNAPLVLPDLEHLEPNLWERR